MLIIQNIWSRWTKAARGANSRLRRPRTDEAYILPPPAETGEVLWHELRAMEIEGFALVERIAPIDRDGWQRAQPHRSTPLDWRPVRGGAEIRLVHPSKHRLRTKWPEFLPSPLFTLRSGETARIDWNGRFRSSMSGSNLAYYYEQHTYWLAIAETPDPRLFLDAQPRKHVDLRTEIY
jgi:hypothetical protein